MTTTAPIMTWKERKVAFSRSDRLRRLAYELGRQDHELDQNQFADLVDFSLGLNEKDNQDNTSASETSKSHHTATKD